MNKQEFYAEFFTEGIYLVNDKDEYMRAEHSQTEVIAEEPVENSAKKKISTTEEKVQRFPYLGVNSEKLAVVVHYEQAEWITTKDKLILEKILAAVNLSLKNIALINIAQSATTAYTEILETFSAQNIIFFGLKPAFTENNDYDVVHTSGQKKILFTRDSLTSIAMNKELKKLLWKNMKELFKL